MNCLARQLQRLRNRFVILKNDYRVPRAQHENSNEIDGLSRNRGGGDVYPFAAPEKI